MIPTPRCYVLDENNQPVEAEFSEMARWFENGGDRIVAYTQITSGVEVSTIFLGIDHGHGRKGPPILFETMVLGGPLNRDGMRYSTWDDAEIGHRAFVRKVRKAMGQKAEP